MDTVEKIKPDAVMVICNAKVEVVKRIKDEFEVLPRRWVVERTFGWLGRYRRLSKDYELLPEVSESMVYAAMVRSRAKTTSCLIFTL